MRYFAICVVLVFCSVPSVFAQESVGFSNPDNIEPLLDYRLPDWGYSNFYLDFDARGTGQDVKVGDTKNVRRNGDFSIEPTYRLFRESEERIFNLNTSVDTRYIGVVQSSSSSSSDTERKRRDFYFDIDFSTDLREYITNRSFLLGEVNMALDYVSSKRENFDDTGLDAKNISYDRNFSATPRVGYGFGRVRNVNPNIRAIRLEERAKAVNGGFDFSRQDIQGAADQFTRYNGYQQTYDRPEKYFWSDMDEAMSPNISSLNTFDMLYLTDVLNEAIGTRLEGWEVIGGAEFDYQNDLDRTEENSTVDRSKYIRKRAGLFVDGRWYENISLTQQWGVTGNAMLSYPLRDGDSNTLEEKRSLSLQAGVNYLWNVSDRFLFRSELSNIYSRSKLEGFSIGGGDVFSQWTNRLLLNNNFSYYLENSLSLTLSLNSTLTHKGNTQSDATLDARRFNWSAGLGLRYYFSRNLY